MSNCKGQSSYSYVCLPDRLVRQLDSVNGEQSRSDNKNGQQTLNPTLIWNFGIQARGRKRATKNAPVDIIIQGNRPSGTLLNGFDIIEEDPGYTKHGGGTPR